MSGYAEILERLERIERLLSERQQEPKSPSLTAWCEAHGISRSTFYKLNLPYAKIGSRSIPNAATDAAWNRLLAGDRTADHADLVDNQSEEKIAAVAHGQVCKHT